MISLLNIEFSRKVNKKYIFFVRRLERERLRVVHKKARKDFSVDLGYRDNNNQPSQPLWRNDARAC